MLKFKDLKIGDFIYCIIPDWYGNLKPHGLKIEQKDGDQFTFIGEKGNGMGYINPFEGYTLLFANIDSANEYLREARRFKGDLTVEKYSEILGKKKVNLILEKRNDLKILHQLFRDERYLRKIERINKFLRDRSK
jgi:hypothetical protein